MINNYTTINTPKHFVTLGRAPGKRMTRNTMDNNVQVITNRIRNSMRIPSNSYAVVPSFVNRDDYGDIDIIIDKKALPRDWEAKFISNIFGGSYHAKIPNTSTTVFDYMGVQVNIHVHEGNIHHAVLYTQKQGAGVLFSILARNLGMTLNLDGLYLNTGIEESPVIELNIDVSYRYRMLGISADQMQYYIYTERDLFKTVMSSVYFNRNAFLAFENDSEYLAKNPIVARFIAYLKTSTLAAGEVSYDVNAENSKKQFIQNLKSYAPKVEMTYMALIKRYRVTLLMDAKYSIEKVTEVTEIHEEFLKKFMDSFAQSFKSYKAFRMFILTSLPDTISKALLKHRNETLKPKQYGPKPEVVVEALPEAPNVEEIPKLKGKAKVKAKAKAKKVVEAEVEAKVAAAKLEVKAKKAAPKKKSVKQMEEEATVAEIVRSIMPQTGPAWPFPSNGSVADLT